MTPEPDPAELLALAYVILRRLLRAPRDPAARAAAEDFLAGEYETLAGLRPKPNGARQGLTCPPSCCRRTA